MQKPTKSIEKTYYAIVGAATGTVLYCGRWENKAAAAWVKGSFWGSGPSRAEAIQDARKKVLKHTTLHESS